MTRHSYEIRLCKTCGLRYPLIEGHPFGERCPACLGPTETIASHRLQTESRAPIKQPSVHLEALLDNIRSAWNVGSMFRTADGIGLKHLYLCGITPTPEADSVRKTSLGAESTVSWTYHKNAVAALKRLKSKGRRIVALEDDPRASPLKISTPGRFSERLLFIVGNEITGVDPGLLDLCDEIVFIPMQGHKKSYNAAVAFGIAAFMLSNFL